MEKMGDGAVTAFYKADRNKVIEVLNEVLATETVCTLRYRNHYFMATGIDASGVEAEFLEHANDEQMHADRVAKRMKARAGRRRKLRADVRACHRIDLVLKDAPAIERADIDTVECLETFLGERRG